jgi:pimeloyl-ACP methyl ester carboxylesterase
MSTHTVSSPVITPQILDTALPMGSVQKAEPDQAGSSSPEYFYYKDYRLAYAEYGAANGTPVFYFHDSGSSRLEAELFHQSAQRNGFRLIVLDRPGIGKSDFFVCARPDDFCAAVAAFAEAKGLKHYGVMSLGAGGIYALTLAHMNPDNVLFKLSLAGVPGSVFNEQGTVSYSATCWNELTPMLVKLLVRIKHRFMRADPVSSIRHLEQHLCAADRHSLADDSLFHTLARDLEEAISRGYEGIAQDIALSYRKLDFRLQEVTVPTEIWQGETDRLSQRSDCEFMTARLPNARFHRVPGRGHFFFMHRMDTVFGELRSALSTFSGRLARQAA